MARFRLKELAHERGWTSEDLALKSGLRIATVRSIWQHRVQDPSYSTLKAMAKALNVRVEDLEDQTTELQEVEDK